MFNTVGYPRPGPRDRHFLINSVQVGHTAGPICEQQDGCENVYPLRRLPFPRAIHGDRPCRYLIIAHLPPGEAEQLCAEGPINVNTFEVRNEEKGSHPWVSAVLSPMVLHLHTRVALTEC